ncbi:hypothetical protein [Elizabethkingia ursingii]|uniref:hypothetical protein n=1 Tax=Elizabethkingia ursingii TaxID=1756150 RepID=UPI0020120C51|nr:hypothetical protein [Elizabethkingia ursingii]MCL1671761.1 hypothetical protein [Elizabethkingia ursingii]
MKEILEKVRQGKAVEFTKDSNPTEYNSVLELVKRGYLRNLGSSETSESLIVNLTDMGREYLKNN